MENETTGTEAQNAGVEKTTENNQNQENSNTQNDESLETLKAQKTHWRDQAIDPETGKKYKDLYVEATKSSTKGDKTPKKNESSSKSDEGLQLQVQKLALKVAGITKESEIDLAQRLQKETGKDWDTLLESKYFKTELEDLRSQEAIETASTDVKGNRGGNSASTAKESADYWKAKGSLPTPDDVPDRKTRVKIIHELRNAEKSQKMFYND